MNRLRKLLQASIASLIIFTHGSAVGVESNSKNLSIEYPIKFFNNLSSFSEGLAAFRDYDGVGYKWGYVDLRGEVVIKPQFDNAGFFSDGLAWVLINDAYGFIDKSGKLVILTEFTYVTSFREGIAIVSKNDLKNIKKIRYGAINKQGQVIIDFLYEDLFGFYEGLSSAKKFGSSKYGFIDKDGKEVIKPEFDTASFFSEGKALVSVREKKNGIHNYGFINRLGEYVIKPKFKDGVSPFSEGLAAVGVEIGKNLKVGFIDETGNFVIKPQYDNAEDFSEGLAAVRIGNAEKGRVGFINKSGEMVINPQFNHVLFQKFKNGFSRVSVKDKNKNELWGFIDKKGNFVIEPKFKFAADFEDNLALVAIDGERDWKYGFLRINSNASQNMKLSISAVVDLEGWVLINVQTKSDTASLTINGEEFGGSLDGSYKIKKIARAGGDTQFTVVAKDIHGNTETKIITVSRPLQESKPLVAALNPAQVKRQPERDAVAIIIGIADYKNLPRADYANDDARVFYDYAIRALGVKPENIKLLVDADADEVGIYRAFKTWLPSRVRASTDVYVYYSGHGLPTADGRGLYVLPQRADRDFIDKTAITQAEINAAIQVAKPKSVTIFLDACYSGQARTGETLLASARPVSLKAETAAFPEGFTVITASRGDQISSSSPELKHGIFSYYLMRGMEGDADANRDGRITAGEMQAYLAENVSRQAGMMNRQQVPQLIGDANRVLVGR
jgi:hypothetical protein